MVRYPLNGRPAAFYRGDWFVGKGVACARIRMGPSQRDIAEVFCTHLHAPYEREPHDSYICHRTAQAWEITKLMRAAAERGHLVIGMGDFNMIPLSLAHRIIETHSPVRDVWRILHPESSIGAAKDKVEKLRGVPMPSAEFNMTVNGATCDSELNSWRWNKGQQRRLKKGENVQIDPAVPDPNAKRLDYIFFSSGRHHNPETKEETAEWELKEANVGMAMRHPTLHCSLSDHFSVEATLTRTSTAPSSVQLSPWALPERYLPIETYDEILTTTLKYQVRERVQRKLRIGHFFYQLSFSIGCLIGVWWSPENYVAFILMLLSTLGFSVGVIDGLMGLLFVGSEIRALKEFEWEVRNMRERALAKAGLGRTRSKDTQASGASERRIRLPHLAHTSCAARKSAALTMSDSQPQQQSNGGQQLLRPDDILKLQCLPEDEKQKYRLIMQNFWTICNQHPQGSQENTNARQKLTEWSQKFITRERQYRAKMKAQQQQQQQQQGNQNQGQAGQSNAGGQQNPNPVKQEGNQAGNRGAESAAGAVGHQSQGQQPSNQGQNQGRGQVDPAIVKHVHEFPMQGPLSGPSPGTPEYEVKLKEYRTGYLNMLAKQASLNENRKKLMQQLGERQNNGQELPQDLLVLKAKIEKEHANMRAQIEKFRALQKTWKEEREQNHQSQTQAQPTNQNPGQSPPQPPQQQPQQQSSQPPNQPQQLQRQPSQPNAPAQPQIKEEPQIKIEGGQPPQPQPQPQSQPQQQQQQNQPPPQSQFNMQGNQGNQQQPPQQPQQPQPQHNQQMPPSLQQQQQPQQQQPRPPPAPHSQTMPPNQMPQFAQQGQQQQNFHQQQQRPQINPMQANAHQQSNSPHPQSATATGPPVPLSHQAAVSAANRSYTDPQRTNTPMQQGGQGGNFGSREREQLNNPKMPIPRHLNVTSPQAVHMGQARPTMSGPTNGAPGPMGQPVIPRPPPFQLEGDGDRVLSKRKLDELVRQVTGGSEEALTPEVEEAVLQLADDFVDNVISNACKLSKLRDSPQLDIRDIQVILERNYNIRIPGYASDEVRTVRKIVPAQGWAAKMNAVNAAKVMGGKTDF
ncbi:transcription initiation factor TFIID subunit 12 [Stemphylium lycopersici]|nr:transcription initiation factor TFIID subunit 12 [Stemphylium lycopersici]